MDWVDIILFSNAGVGLVCAIVYGVCKYRRKELDAYSIMIAILIWVCPLAALGMVGYWGIKRLWFNPEKKVAKEEAKRIEKVKRKKEKK